jgi:opacity protein-like surface antigen
MKKALMTLGLAVLLAAPAMAGSVGVYGAWWTTDDANDSLGLGGWIDFYLGRGIEIEFRGSHFSDFETVNDLDDRADLRITSYDLGFTYNFGYDSANKLNPYLGIGGSLLSAELDRIDNDKELGTLDDEFGYYAVGGIELPISKYFAFVAEAMYRSAKFEILGNDLGFSGVKQVVDVQGFEGNLGVAFKW